MISKKGRKSIHKGIKRIDGERIKAKMKRRFEKDGGERMY